MAARMPAAFRRASRPLAASRTPGLCWATGMTMAWMGAMRGQHQAAVVAVGHDDAANHAGGHAPAGLVGVVELVVLAGEGDVEGPGKAVAEVVAGARLEGSFRSCIMHSTV